MRRSRLLFAFPLWKGVVSRKAASSYRSLPHWGRGTASAVDRVLSYIVDLRRISPLIFHTARTLSGSLCSPPSPRGEGFVSGIVVFSFRCLPHRERGTASAVDRLLSFIVDLRRSSSLSFIPLEPYPARSARHLPHAGKALSVVILFLHISCIRFDDARKAVFSYRSLPHWGRGTAPAVDRVLSYIVDLRRISPTLFHTARTLSGSLRSPPSPRREGFVRRYSFSPRILYSL